LTITYDPLTFTQGRVTNIEDDAANPNQKVVTVQLLDGYFRPANITEWDRVTVFDPVRRLAKAQRINASVSYAGTDDTTRLVEFRGAAQQVAVNDIVTFAWGEGPNGISVDGANTTWEDITMHASPGFAFFNSSGGGNTHLNRFRLVPGPPPANSGVHPSQCTAPIQANRAYGCPILTSSWDGIQFKLVKVGPTVENSEVVNAGDDSMSIQGMGEIKIFKIEDKRIWVKYNNNSGVIQPGDRLQQWIGDDWAIVDAHDLCTAERDECKVAKPGQPDKFDFMTAIVTLRTNPIWGVGSHIADIDRMGNDFNFSNNTIDSSGRGLLIKAHGFPLNPSVIANNTIRGSKPISFTPQEGDWGDSHAGTGGYVDITGNNFRSALWSAGQGYSEDCEIGAVSFWGRTTSRRAFSDITIAGNHFEDIRGLNLNIGSATDVVVRDNVFLRPHRIAHNTAGNKCSIPHSSVVHVYKSDHVTFEINRITPDMGPYGQEMVSRGLDTSNIEGLPDGIRESP
jgi:hypothetical protein